MKDNTVNKKSEKWKKWVIEQIISEHKKLRNEEKYYIKHHETLFTIIFKNCYVFYNLTSVKQTDKIVIE